MDHQALPAGDQLLKQPVSKLPEEWLVPALKELDERAGKLLREFHGHGKSRKSSKTLDAFCRLRKRRRLLVQRILKMLLDQSAALKKDPDAEEKKTAKFLKDLAEKISKQADQHDEDSKANKGLKSGSEAAKAWAILSRMDSVSDISAGDQLRLLQIGFDNITRWIEIPGAGGKILGKFFEFYSKSMGAISTELDEIQKNINERIKKGLNIRSLEIDGVSSWNTLKGWLDDELNLHSQSQYLVRSAAKARVLEVYMKRNELLRKRLKEGSLDDVLVDECLGLRIRESYEDYKHTFPGGPHVMDDLEGMVRKIHDAARHREYSNEEKLDHWNEWSGEGKEKVVRELVSGQRPLRDWLSYFPRERQQELPVYMDRRCEDARTRVKKLEEECARLKKDVHWLEQEKDSTKTEDASKLRDLQQEIRHLEQNEEPFFQGWRADGKPFDPTVAKSSRENLSERNALYERADELTQELGNERRDFRQRFKKLYEEMPELEEKISKRKKEVFSELNENYEQETARIKKRIKALEQEYEQLEKTWAEKRSALLQEKRAKLADLEKDSQEKTGTLEKQLSDKRSQQKETCAEATQAESLQEKACREAEDITEKVKTARALNCADFAVNRDLPRLLGIMELIMTAETEARRLGEGYLHEPANILKGNVHISKEPFKKRIQGIIGLIQIMDKLMNDHELIGFMEDRFYHGNYEPVIPNEIRKRALAGNYGGDRKMAARDLQILLNLVNDGQLQLRKRRDALLEELGSLQKQFAACFERLKNRELVPLPQVENQNAVGEQLKGLQGELNGRLKHWKDLLKESEGKSVRTGEGHSGTYKYWKKTGEEVTRVLNQCEKTLDGFKVIPSKDGLEKTGALREQTGKAKQKLTINEELITGVHKSAGGEGSRKTGRQKSSGTEEFPPGKQSVLRIDEKKALQKLKQGEIGKGGGSRTSRNVFQKMLQGLHRVLKGLPLSEGWLVSLGVGGLVIGGLVIGGVVVGGFMRERSRESSTSDMERAPVTDGPVITAPPETLSSGDGETVSEVTRESDSREGLESESTQVTEEAHEEEAVESESGGSLPRITGLEFPVGNLVEGFDNNTADIYTEIETVVLDPDGLVEGLIYFEDQDCDVDYVNFEVLGEDSAFSDFWFSFTVQELVEGDRCRGAVDFYLENESSYTWESFWICLRDKAGNWSEDGCALLVVDYR